MKRGTVTEKTVAVPFLERRHQWRIQQYWISTGRGTNALLQRAQKSYGKYCYSIAYHILHDREDTEECLNDTWMRAWNAIPPKKPNRLELFWEQLPAICRLIDGRGVMHRNVGNGTMDMTLDELAECIPAAHDAGGKYCGSSGTGAEHQCVPAYTFGTGMQCIFAQILVRGGICPDRRALWNESEYGEDIAVPDQKKTAKISGTTGNRLIDGEDKTVMKDERCNKNNNQDVNLKEEKLFRAMSGVEEELLHRSGQNQV